MLISLIFISSFWWSLIFYNFQVPVDIPTWDIFFAFSELQRKSILEYKQFPLWNPYVAGGEPWLAHPYSNFLSPCFLFVLIFGAIPGIIITHLLYVITGLSGMYYLSRYYRLNSALCLLNSIFFLNVFNIITFKGSQGFLNIAFLPWVCLFLNKAKKDSAKKYYFLIAVFLALTIYVDAPYIFAMLFMIISYDAFIYALKQRSIQPLISVLRILLLTFLLGSIKILPMVELLYRFPRPIKLECVSPFLSFENIQRSFMQIKYFLFSGTHLYIKGLFFCEGVVGYNFSKAAIFLLVLSFFLLWKRYKALVMLNIFFIFLALGNNSPINIWRLIRFLPFFDWLRGPAKFFFVVIPLWSLSLGLTLREIYSRLPKVREKSHIINTLVIFSVCSGVFICAVQIPIKWEGKKEWYNLRYSDKEFYQTSGEDKKMFEAVFNNRGFLYTVDDSIGELLPTKVLPEGHSDYRGEYFLLNGFGKVKQDFFSPNKLKFNVEASKDDILLINQNYFSGWRSSVGRVINQNGLIGVPVAKGCRKITLYYLPLSFIIGAAIFFLWLCVFIFVNLYKLPYVHRRIQGILWSSGIRKMKS